MSQTINLIGKCLIAELAPEQVTFAPNGRQIVVEPRKCIRFTRGRATVDEDTFRLLEQSPLWTGIGHEKVVWLESDAAAPEGDSGPMVITGTVSTASMNQPKPPTQGYDEMTPAMIRKAIADAKLDPEKALEYERATKRRKAVVKFLVQEWAKSLEDDAPQAQVAKAQAAADDDTHQLGDVAVPIPENTEVK